MANPCSNCNTAREFPEYRMFCPSCIYCGARLIQRIGLLPIGKTEASERRTKVLKDWTQYGHSEKEIRGLVAGPPALGPAKTLESVAQESTKPHSRKRK